SAIDFWQCVVCQSANLFLLGAEAEGSVAGSQCGGQVAREVDARGTTVGIDVLDFCSVFACDGGGAGGVEVSAGAAHRTGARGIVGNVPKLGAKACRVVVLRGDACVCGLRAGNSGL